MIDRAENRPFIFFRAVKPSAQPASCRERTCRPPSQRLVSPARKLYAIIHVPSLEEIRNGLRTSPNKMQNTSQKTDRRSKTEREEVLGPACIAPRRRRSSRSGSGRAAAAPPRPMRTAPPSSTSGRGHVSFFAQVHDCDGRRDFRRKNASGIWESERALRTSR